MNRSPSLLYTDGSNAYEIILYHRPLEGSFLQLCFFISVSLEVNPFLRVKFIAASFSSKAAKSLKKSDPNQNQKPGSVTSGRRKLTSGALAPNYQAPLF